MLHRGGCVCTHQSSIRLIKRPGALEAEAKVSNLWLSQGSWVEELFTQEQQGCSARSWDIQLCAHSLPGGVGFQLKEEGGRLARHLHPHPHIGGPGGCRMEGVSLLAGSLWLSWGCWGWFWSWWGSPGITVALCWPGQGFPIPAKDSLVPPAPAAKGFFLLLCGKASPTATTQLLLPCLGSCLHFQISKRFLGSLFSPSTLCLGFVFHSYSSLCRFVPVIAAVPCFPAGLLCRELQVGCEI